MPLKTTVNWLFNDISYCLVIGCFNWKIRVFQQRIVRVYYILKDQREELSSPGLTEIGSCNLLIVHGAFKVGAKFTAAI